MDALTAPDERRSWRRPRRRPQGPSSEPDEATGARVDVDTLASVILLVAGLVTWSLSVRSLPFERMTDVGIASILPPAAWLGMGLVAAGFVLALRSGRTALVVAAILATIVVLTGPGVIVEPTARFGSTWRHVGIADYIRTHGSVDPALDAYFNWPGFFLLVAFIWDVTGIRDLTAVVKWVPLAFDLMYLAPLVVIGRALVERWLVVWLGIWLFYVNNWIGQDYFSPQGLYYFIYLVVLAILLHWFRAADRPRPRLQPREPDPSRLPRLADGDGPGTREPPPTADTRSERIRQAVLFCTVVLLIGSTVASHQLTPFALVLSTGALVAVGWCRLRTLPVIALLLFLLWASYMAVAFFSGHLLPILHQVGSVDASVGANIGNRLHGSVGHETVVRLRLLSTGLLWLAALAGALRLRRTGKPLIGLAALAIAPFPLLVLQPYGGEVLLRIAFFSLPFMAFLAASALPMGTNGRLTRAGTALLVVIGGMFVASFPFTRFGNERMDYYSAKEVAAVQELYRIAPRGSTLVSVSASIPWLYRGYVDYDRRSLAALGSAGNVDLAQPSPRLLVRDVADRMTSPPGSPLADEGVRRDAFLIVTRSQAGELELMGAARPGTVPRLVDILRRSKRFRVVYRNSDATIFELVPTERRAVESTRAGAPGSSARSTGAAQPTRARAGADSGTVAPSRGSTPSSWHVVIWIAAGVDVMAAILALLAAVVARALRVPLLLVALTVAAITWEQLGGRSPVRAVVVAGFVLVAPGWAMLDIWRLAKGWAGISLIAALNVALATTTAAALLYAGAWSPTAVLLILGAVTLLASTVAIVQRGRERELARDRS